MTKYAIIYGHHNNTPGHLNRAFACDDDAIDYTRKLVSDGYRNEQWAVVTLSSGADVRFINRNGIASATV